MCELFAMSSRLPTTVRFSLEAFSRHGGLDGPHKDGWGIAHYADGDVNLLREAAPAASSACVRFIQDHPIVSPLVISHIRKATRGANALRNCQPFTRELGGRMHVFAHNGNLDAALLRDRYALGAFHPVGDTDSEYAFCALLERLRALWRGTQLPELSARRAMVEQFAGGLRELGPANFLYCDGDALFAHGHRRTQADHTIAPPGLHVLQRQCLADADALTTDGLSLRSAIGQSVVLLASVPLTHEPAWRALDEGELLIVREGEIA